LRKIVLTSLENKFNIRFSPEAFRELKKALSINSGIESTAQVFKARLEEK